MNQIHIQYYRSLVGELILGSFEKRLCLCDWRDRKARSTIDSRILENLKARFVEKEDDVLKKSIRELKAYFNCKRTRFEIPLLMIGTDFQKSVWKELLQVSFGTVSSYLQLAQRIRNKNAVRAVANANGANALAIFIPCHRIIGHNGELVGYAGGLEAKEKLLKLERNSMG